VVDIPENQQVEYEEQALEDDDEGDDDIEASGELGDDSMDEDE
jgi:hypothetical protein